MIKVIEKDVLSTDRIHQLKGKIYIPETPAKGLVHVVHGMCEYIGRYDRFMRDLAKEGYIVFGYDHLGHGLTAAADGELGFIAEKDGWERLVDDVFVYGNDIRKAMGGDLPFILMGHSMGSFIVRLCAAKYNHYDKLIVMGTGGPNPLATLGINTARFIKRSRGDRYISKAIYKSAFGSYNKHFEDENDPLSWLSVDRENRDIYRADKFCNYSFTVSAMEDLIRLNKGANEKTWFSAVDRTKPILLVSGAEDPVGDYGEGVKKVYDALVAAGADVRMKLYDGYRHEILKDACYDEVVSDIKRFIAD